MFAGDIGDQAVVRAGALVTTLVLTLDIGGCVPAQRIKSTAEYINEVLRASIMQRYRAKALCRFMAIE
jgi:hypothetical protein